MFHRSHLRRETDVSGLGVSYSLDNSTNLWYGLGFHFVSELVLQWKVWWRLMRIPSSPCTLTIGGVNSTHYTTDFVYTNFRSTSDWQVNLDGLKLNGAAVETTLYKCCFVVEFANTCWSTVGLIEKDLVIANSGWLT